MRSTCLSRSCVSFDAVFDKKICYFATTPLTALNDTVLAPDADGAVFFVSAWVSDVVELYMV